MLGMPKGSNGTEQGRSYVVASGGFTLEKGLTLSHYSISSRIFVDLCTVSVSILTCISDFMIVLRFVLRETRHSKKNFNLTLTLY